MKKIVSLLIVLLCTALNVFAEENTNVDFTKLIFLKLSFTQKFYMDNYRDIRSKDTIKYFYIDTKNKKVYTEDKEAVDYIKNFDDKMISFMTIVYTKDIKRCDCYDINRYTGNVEYYLFMHPISVSAKINQKAAGIDKDGLFSKGHGTVEKVKVDTQRF